MLQEIAQRARVALSMYITVQSVLGYLPYFTCNLELVGLISTGERAQKQSENNVSMTSWSSLKKCKCFLKFYCFIYSLRCTFLIIGIIVPCLCFYVMFEKHFSALLLNILVCLIMIYIC